MKYLLVAATVMAVACLTLADPFDPPKGYPHSYLAQTSSIGMYMESCSFITFRSSHAHWVRSKDGYCCLRRNRILRTFAGPDEDNMHEYYCWTVSLFHCVIRQRYVERV